MMDLIGFMRVFWDKAFREMNDAILTYKFKPGDYDTDPIYNPALAFDSKVKTEEYSLLHLRSSYQLKNVRFDFGIENALDELYNHPLGGAYMGQGKTMSGTGVPWGELVPGMGRSIYAGVNVKF